MSASDRRDILQTLEAELTANYLFPETAARIVAGLPARAGAYDKTTDAVDFGNELSNDLRELGNDKHFRVSFDPDFHQRATPEAMPSAQDMEHQRAETEQLAFGVEKVQRLPGNVAYVELRGFGPTELVGSAYASSMNLVAGSEALILDLRRNDGGSQEDIKRAEMQRQAAAAPLRLGLANGKGAMGRPCTTSHTSRASYLQASNESVLRRAGQQAFQSDFSLTLIVEDGRTFVKNLVRWPITKTPSLLSKCSRNRLGNVCRSICARSDRWFTRKP